MVLGWGFSLGLLAAILPAWVISQHRIETAKTQRETEP